MIDIYIMCYNEEKLIQFTIDHYKNSFKDCRIVFYDNESTDNTLEIIRKNNCEVRTFKTNGTLNDRILVDVKNSCWKEQSNNDFVIVVDADELVQMTDKDIIKESREGATIIDLEGYT